MAGTAAIGTYANIKPLGVVNGSFIYAALEGGIHKLNKVSTGTPGLITTFESIAYPYYYDGYAYQTLDHAFVTGNIFFNANLGKLWKTNGTTAGTVKVSNNSGYTFTEVNNLLFFERENAIWKSNGTEAGTVLVKK